MSAAGNPLEDLRARLVTLGDEPLDQHPLELERVHRTIVAELDGLAGPSREASRPGDGQARAATAAPPARPR